MNDINPDGIKKPCNCGLDSLTAQLEEARKVLTAGRAWRTAEVHHAAITLGLRDGDEKAARNRVDDATRELRIAIGAAMQQKEEK